MKQTFAPGDKVICLYRIPCSHQWWIAPIRVGIVEEPGTDPAHWNGSNSEADYCRLAGKTRVRYSFGAMQDHTDDLRLLESETTQGFLRAHYGEDNLPQVHIDYP